MLSDEVYHFCIGSERRGSHRLVEYPRRTSNTTRVQVAFIDREGVVNVRVVNESIEDTNRVGVINCPRVDMNRTKLKYSVYHY